MPSPLLAPASSRSFHFFFFFLTLKALILVYTSISLLFVLFEMCVGALAVWKINVLDVSALGTTSGTTATGGGGSGGGGRGGGGSGLVNLLDLVAPVSDHFGECVVCYDTKPVRRPPSSSPEQWASLALPLACFSLVSLVGAGAAACPSQLIMQPPRSLFSTLLLL